MKTRLSTALHMMATAASAFALATAAGAAVPVGKREKLPAPPPMTAPALSPETLWICDDGQSATIRYDAAAGVAQARRGAEQWTLQEQVGTNPQRFVSGNDTAAIDGDMVELKRGKDLRSTCSMVPTAPVEGRLWGTLNLPEGATLPAGSKAKILLVNASRADAPAIEISGTRFVTRGNQAPFSFLLMFPPEQAAPAPATYRLQARIENPAGKLQYITDTAAFVLENTPANPPVDLSLVAVKN